jgi:CheY-like chemotaxis protein
MKHTNHMILLVEDDPDDVLLIKEALAEIPAINLVHQKNGWEGLKYLEDSKNNHRPLPCLIIMDMNMPVLHGKKLLAMLKNEIRFEPIPVIVFATSSNENDKKYCEDRLLLSLFEA